MKPLKCSGDNDGISRQTYCGVCKTIGRQYNQSMRLSLNYDIAFFAQLLSELSNRGPAPFSRDHWPDAFFHANCFSLPKKDNPVPLPFSISADVNILLTHLTLEDKNRDSSGTHRQKVWKFLLKQSTKPYRDARHRLEALGFSLAGADTLNARQQVREQNKKRYGEGPESLDYFSEPTAAFTGDMFRSAARTVTGAGFEVEESVYRLGRAFGRLIYLLDAREDYEKDIRHRHFNGIAAAYGLKNSPMPTEVMTAMTTLLLETAGEIQDLFKQIPMSEQSRKGFSKRLEVNLRRRLELRGKLETDVCIPTGETPGNIPPQLQYADTAQMRHNPQCRRHGKHRRQPFRRWGRFFRYPMMTAAMPVMWLGHKLWTAAFAIPGVGASDTPSSGENVPDLNEPDKRENKASNFCFFCCPAACCGHPGQRSDDKKYCCCEWCDCCECGYDTWLCCPCGEGDGCDCCDCDCCGCDC